MSSVCDHADPNPPNPPPPLVLNHIFNVGDRRLKFSARPFNQNQFLHEGLQTGNAVWPASRILVEYLNVQRDWLLKLHCIELGCGIGVCGMAAACLGAAHVTLTDGDTDVLDQARAAVSLNGLNASDIDTCSLRWGENETDSLADVRARMASNKTCADTDRLVIASDALYGVRVPPDALRPTLDSRVFSLFALVDQLALGQHTEFLLAFENRGDVTLEEVLAVAKHFSWTFEIVATQDLFDNCHDYLTDFWARCVIHFNNLGGLVDVVQPSEP
jgi:predicted nicotinamide N-methyase